MNDLPYPLIVSNLLKPQRLPRLGALLCFLCLGVAGSISPLFAQTKLRDPNEAVSVVPRIPGARQMSTHLKLAGKETTAEHIMAVVNNELITFTDVDKRVARIMDNAPEGSSLPGADTLRQKVLDALIDERIQLQLAQSMGMVVADAEVDEAVARLAAQNQMTLTELRSRMSADGLDYNRYRNSLREQMMLERIRFREVNRRIVINDDDIDAFNAQKAASGRDMKLHLAHILIAVPANINDATRAQLAEKANGLRQRAQTAAIDFGQLAREFSDDTGTKNEGGSFGLRPADNLPTLFTDAVKSLNVGDIAPLLRSGAGFHVIKLIDRQTSANQTYVQQRARHILIRTSPQMSEKQALAEIADIQKKIASGQASFEQMAREKSQDGSAAGGGDLGFASPGQFVPEFEKALNMLQVGEISPPVISRFGVHLIELVERREVPLTEQQIRDAVLVQLREQRFESAYDEWASELRSAAFVEMRYAH